MILQILPTRHFPHPSPDKMWTHQAYMGFLSSSEPIILCISKTQWRIQDDVNNVRPDYKCLPYHSNLSVENRKLFCCWWRCSLLQTRAALKLSCSKVIILLTIYSICLTSFFLAWNKAKLMSSVFQTAKLDNINLKQRAGSSEVIWTLNVFWL